MRPTPPPGPSRLDSPRLIRNGIFLLGIEVTAKFLGLFFFIILARFLGARELGLYAYALTLANFFVLLPKFGFESLVQREVGRDHSLSWNYFRAISGLKALLTLGSFLLLAILAGLTMSGAEIPVVLLVAGFVFTYSFMEFVDTFFRALEQAEWEVLVRLWFSLVNLALGFFILYSGGGLEIVMLGQLASVLTAVLIALTVLRHLTELFRDQRLQMNIWRYFVNAAPFAGIIVALYFSNQMGVLILSLFADKTEVGYLAAGLRLFDNLTLIPAALMGALLPVMSRYYRTSVKSFTTTLRLTLKYLLIFSAPLAVGMFCLASPLTILLFKEAFLPTADALKILSLALIFSFWNYLGDNVLIARNQEKRLLQLAWLGAAIHVAANFFLVPHFSYLGACWATLATQVFYFIFIFGRLRRYLDLPGLVRLAWRPTLAAAIMGLGVSSLKSIPVVLVILAGMGIYALMLLITRALSPLEIKAFKEVWQVRSGSLQPSE